jgi:hypothetical protein
MMVIAIPVVSNIIKKKWMTIVLYQKGGNAYIGTVYWGEIMAGQIILPRECEIVKEFANHLHNVAKKLEEDEETGSKRYIYVKLGSTPDHFRHAFNYECMARQNCPNLLFAELL